MSKSSKRAKVAAEKRSRKIAQVNQGTSKYAAKRAMGFTENSPFFLDSDNPQHETIEQARKREYEERQQQSQSRGEWARS